MKILFFITGLGNGGAEKQLYNLATSLNRKPNYTIKIISLFGGDYLKKFRKLGIYTQVFFCKQNFSLIKAIQLFKKSVRTFKPTIVHSFLYHSNIITKISLFFLKKDFKLICSYRSLTKKYPLLALLEFINQGKSDFLVTNSKRSLQDLEIYNIYNVPKKAIYNGFNYQEPNKELKEKLKRKYKDRRIIFTVGRFTPEKDYITNIRTAIELSKIRDDFVFVYAGVRNYQKYYELARAQKMLDKIEFIGKIDYVPELMSISEIFFLPTLYESQCNALIEAMYFKVPIVTTDNLENLEIVQSAKFCPKKDYRKMAKELDTLLDCNDLDLDKNYKFVKNDLNINNMVRNYRKLYEDLLS